MGVISRGAIFGGALLLIIVGIAILRFLIHELVRFVEISAILVVVILVLAWLVARRSAPPTTSRP
jgi:H+/gluconate symporter-like permease